MAKSSSVEKNKNRKKLVSRYAARRAALKAIINNRETSMEDRFQAQLRLASLPRNSAQVRVRNRCCVSGRPRGYYRKLGISRIALRELGGLGLVPGLVKSSW